MAGALRNMGLITRVCEAHTVSRCLAPLRTYRSIDQCSPTRNDGLVTTRVVVRDSSDMPEPIQGRCPLEAACKPGDGDDTVRGTVA